MEPFLFGVEITTRVFVGGLPFKMTELELEECFEQYGSVKDAKIITDRQGIPKGYGFVTFGSEEEAARVQAKGSIFYKEKKLNVSKAIRKHGGQFARANQEYVNGQRQLFMHPEGFIMSQHGPSWFCEPVVSHSQPTKPCFSLLGPVYTYHQPSPYMQTSPMVSSPVTYPSQILQPNPSYDLLNHKMSNLSLAAGPPSPQYQPTGPAPLMHPVGPPLYKTPLLPAPHIPLPPPLALPPPSSISSQSSKSNNNISNHQQQ